MKEGNSQVALLSYSREISIVAIVYRVYPIICKKASYCYSVGVIHNLAVVLKFYDDL